MDVVLIPTNPTTYGGFVETMVPSSRKIGLNRTELETRVAHLATPKIALPEYIDGSA